VPGPLPAEERLVARLYDAYRDEEQITLILGAGVGGTATPWVADVLRLAEQYAVGRSDGGDLTQALAHARARVPSGGAAPMEVYTAYRQVFGAWVSSNEFDVIVQQAVLERYRPPDRMATPLATHGLWQRVSGDLGEWLENDRGSWLLSPAAEALGAILARMPAVFDNRVITTTLDPQLEVAIRTANGRAISTPLDANGDYDHTAGYDNAVRVFHLHGLWRPMGADDAATLVHDPTRFTSKRTITPIAELITGDTVCVLGTSDWAGTVTAALAEVARHRPINVLWALHPDDESMAARRREQLAAEGVRLVEVFTGVDSERLFTELARRLRITVIPRAAGPRHRLRHPIWERDFVSHPTSTAPADLLGLLRQLERRFGWRFQPAAAGTPTQIFWPVRLRARASVIHMAQALVAGALVRRGADLVVCLDDFGIHEPAAARVPFEADLLRWIRGTAPDAEPEIVSLSEFIKHQREHPAPEDLLRPMDPWTVAREFYGEHNPSLYSVLAAIKAVPNVAPHELEQNAWPIVQALQRRNANRLLTPMTMWSYLHHLLLRHPAQSIMTLGGRDEALFWEQWREMYRFGIAQLYNPHIKSLTNKSEMLRWSSVEDLRSHLADVCAMPGWDSDGSYVPWLFQNALLLPIYLTGAAPPLTGEFALDSWPGFMAALDAGAPVLDILAEQVTFLYRGTRPD
jgi:hypothetical protein